MPGYCFMCRDGDGGCVYPYYGVAPHLHVPGPDGGFIGSTKLLPREQWPPNFAPDAEDESCGVYTHCLYCGAPTYPNRPKDADTPSATHKKDGE
jgi:hypothetical protein